MLREAQRVLRPGDVFGIYDVMREGEGDLSFPVPWASSTETSFIDSNVRVGSTYRYRIRSVDKRGNASAPSPPAEARPVSEE